MIGRVNEFLYGAKRSSISRNERRDLIIMKLPSLISRSSWQRDQSTFSRHYRISASPLTEKTRTFLIAPIALARRWGKADGWNFFFTYDLYGADTGVRWYALGVLSRTAQAPLSSNQSSMSRCLNMVATGNHRLRIFRECLSPTNSVSSRENPFQNSRYKAIDKPMSTGIIDLLFIDRSKKRGYDASIQYSTSLW